MKKLLILLLIISSCKKEVYYYPSKDFFEKYSPKEIIIDDLNFQEVTDSIRNGLYRKEKYFIELQDTDFRYRVTPFAYTGGYIKEKNVLEIVDDSLWFSANKVSIKELGKYMKLHYENNEKKSYLPDSYKRAFMKLIIEPKDDSVKLKNKLLHIIQVYNRTTIKNKDSIDLHIMLDYYLDKVYPQTIPPTPSSSIIIE